MNTNNQCGDVPDGIYTQQQIDFVNSFPEENLRSALLHYVRLLHISSDENLKYENKLNALENIILDARRDYPEAKILTIAEARAKHGDIPSYVKKFGVLNKMFERFDEVNQSIQEGKEISPELSKNFMTFPLTENPLSDE